VADNLNAVFPIMRSVKNHIHIVVTEIDDSLVSIVQMPKGAPVATVGIGSSCNAAFLACQILSLKYPFLRDKIRVHKKELEIIVETEANSIRKRTFHL
jgi:phosphoribosylcarboxyaminoimidazole (NCAIR) mutase